MNSTCTTVLATAIAMALGGAATAQESERAEDGRYEPFASSESGQQASQKLDELDTNRDERIDEAEAQNDPQLVAAWADVDVNDDGAVNATEYYLYAAQRRIAELEAGGAARAQSGSEQGAGRSSAQASQRAGSPESSDAERAARQEAAEQASQQRRPAEREDDVGAERRSQAQQIREEERARIQAAEQSEESERESRRAADERRSAAGPGQDEERAGAAPGPASVRSDEQGAREGGSSGPYPAFEEVDRDSDGEITRTELALVEGLEFTTADENQNGRLSRDEYEQAARER